MKLLEKQAQMRVVPYSEAILVVVETNMYQSFGLSSSWAMQSVAGVKTEFVAQYPAEVHAASRHTVITRLPFLPGQCRWELLLL